MNVFHYIIQKICFWRRNNTIADAPQWSSDDEADEEILIDRKELNNKLTERFGSCETHQENLQGFISSDLITIGSGGFSVVKKGYSTKHDSDVAIKIIRLDEQDNQSYIKKYLPVELELWKQLSGPKHENILNLLDCFSMGPFLYIITELVDHGDLYQCVLSSALSEFKAKSFFRQMVDAVDFCHSLGIAHRDIKPENLLLTRDESIKLADFSFVTNENPIHSQHCGTPGMIAPEQASRHSYNPFKSDIWQLGITLYIMLFRKSPYEKTRKVDLLAEIQTLNSSNNTYKNVPFPRNKMLSLDCKDLIANMLAIEAEERIDVQQVKESAWLNP